MTLKNLLAEGRVRTQKTSANEIGDLLRVVDRDMADARVEEISTDRRFATAYNAALQLATIAICAAGYRVVGKNHHWTTFNVLPEILGPKSVARTNYFDQCRSKRNVSDYDRAGEISENEVEEIISETEKFRKEIMVWMKRNHPALWLKGTK